MTAECAQVDWVPAILGAGLALGLLAVAIGFAWSMVRDSDGPGAPQNLAPAMFHSHVNTIGPDGERLAFTVPPGMQLRVRVTAHFPNEPNQILMDVPIITAGGEGD